LEDLARDGKIALKWILKKQNGRVWTAFNRLRIGMVASSCEHGKEPLGSIKDEKFLG
jgi:hypothetical protein